MKVKKIVRAGGRHQGAGHSEVFPITGQGVAVALQGCASKGRRHRGRWLASWAFLGGFLFCGLSPSIGEDPGYPFRRGDMNASGGVDLSDAVAILGYLFLGVNPPTCMDAADWNDDGFLDISDAIDLLNFFFLGGRGSRPPYPDCGIDPTPDGIDCSSYEPCSGECMSRLSQWTPLIGVQSTAGPAMATLRSSAGLDVMAIAAAVARDGFTYYTEIDSPGEWTPWTPVAGDLVTRFATDSSPVLLEEGARVHIFARGADDSLRRSVKDASHAFTPWSSSIAAGKVRGRISAALSRATASGSPEIHVVYASGSGVEYARFAGSALQSTKRWEGIGEGVLGTDGKEEVWVALKGSNRLFVERAAREGGWSFAPVTSRLYEGPQGRLLDVSNVVYFMGAFHVACLEKFLSDDVTGSYTIALAHHRFVSGEADDGFVRFIATFAGAGAESPRAALAIYRNKLLVAYRDEAESVQSARWDNTDPSMPWVGKESVACGRTPQRPALAVLNLRPRLRAADGDYAAANFGHDLLAAVTGSSNQIHAINFSRAVLKEEIDRQFALFDQATLSCHDALPPIDLALDDRPVITELGYDLWVLPHWLSETVYPSISEYLCQKGIWTPDGTAGRIQPPCESARLPVMIKPSGGLYTCAGISVNETSSYAGIMEELGHYLASAVGLSDQGQTPTSEYAAVSGIPLPALLEAFAIFGEKINGQCTSNGPGDSCPDTRMEGFTGIANNYDAGSRQHSFIYALYYYFLDGDKIRKMIKEDIFAGDNLLLRKYNWVKRHIFRGMEFKLESDPLVFSATDLPDLAVEALEKGAMSFPVSGEFVVPVRVVVRNAGLGHALPFEIDLLSSSGSPVPYSSASFTSIPLAPEDSVTFSGKITLPKSTPLGSTFRLKARVDAGGEVRESNEGNNESSILSIDLPDECATIYDPDLHRPIRVCTFKP